MNQCALFIGPSAPRIAAPAFCTRFPPAALGSIFRAVESGYTTIALVDGYFGNVPSVWHKEILFAMSKGVVVYGASSMGALRAAELCRYGMIGVGTVFGDFKSGKLTDDDEVCVIHAPSDFQFHPFTYAMVNIRATAEAMNHCGALSDAESASFVAHMKRAYFAKRDMSRVREFFASTTRDESICNVFLDQYRDVKLSDATDLFHILANPCGRQAASKSEGFDFPHTQHWKMQFEINQADIPSLGQDSSECLIISDDAP